MRPNPDPVTVRELAHALDARLDFVVLTGREGLDREIVSIQLQKPGLVLTGAMDTLHSERIQVFGRSEVAFLNDSADHLERVMKRLCQRGVPAIFVTRGMKPPEKVLSMAGAAGIPVLATAHDTAETIDQIHHFLAVRLAPRVQVHGVLVDVFGVGILLIGESGIGKSECALELVTRGHRLVADDAVDVRLIEGELIGGSPELTRHYLEVRGIGLIDTREMFGISSVTETKVIDQAIRLVHYDPQRSYERLGAAGLEWEVLGHQVPLIELPVAPGRNVAVLLEIAARQRLLREQGSDPVGEIQAAMARRMGLPDQRDDKGETSE